MISIKVFKRKKSILQLIILLTLLFSSEKAVYAEVHFVAGFGAVGSEKQDEIMKDTYSDYAQSGGGSMLDLELGVSFDIVGGLSTTFKYNLYAYRAEFKNQSFGTSSYKSNAFSVPGVSLQYLFGDKNLGVYIGGYYGKNSVSTSFARVEKIEADGDITGVFAGMMFRKFMIELGTLKIPATIETDTVPQTSEDFGGTYFMLKYSI